MIKYDKLTNLENIEEYFDFKCPECKCDGMKKGNFKLIPTGIPFKPDMVNNKDIKNDIVKRYYDSLPYLKEALVQAIQKDNHNIIIECNKCKTRSVIYSNIKLIDIRKWISKNLPMFLDLGAK